MQADLRAPRQLFTNQSLVRLIIPLLIEQVLAMAIGIADTVMVSSLGEAAVSGVSLVDSINILLFNLFSAMATGGAVVASQYIGKGDREKANTTARQLYLVCLFSALAIMCIALVGNKFILHTIFGQVDDSVMQNAMTYFALRALSYPVLAIYNACAALYRSMGNSKAPMCASAVMNLINVFLNAVTIYFLKWGVAGAALSTVAAQTVAAVYMMKLIRNDRNPVYIDNLLNFRLKLDTVKRILKVGIPNGVENSMFQVGKLLVLSLASTLGTSAIAANAVCNNVAGIVILPGSAVSLALLPVVGQCIGAGAPDQARKNTGKLMAAAYVMVAITGGITLIFTQPLISVFNLTPEAAQMAVEIMRLYAACSMVLWLPSFTLPNALRGAGDVNFTMWVSMISMWVFRVGFSYLLVDYMKTGIIGVWIAMVIDWIARDIAYIIRYFRGEWLKKKVI